MPGETFELKEDLGLGDPVDLTFKIMNQRQPERRSGIAIRVDGKIVGKPGFFGLEEDELFPKISCAEFSVRFQSRMDSKLLRTGEL